MPHPETRSWAPIPTAGSPCSPGPADMGPMSSLVTPRRSRASQRPSRSSRGWSWTSSGSTPPCGCSRCRGWSGPTRKEGRSSPSTGGTGHSSSVTRRPATWTRKPRSSRCRWTRRWPSSPSLRDAAGSDGPTPLCARSGRAPRRASRSRCGTAVSGRTSPTERSMLRSAKVTRSSGSAWSGLKSCSPSVGPSWPMRRRRSAKRRRPAEEVLEAGAGTPGQSTRAAISASGPRTVRSRVT